MSTCKFCGVEFDLTNKKRGWMANHTKWCDKNPKLEEYKRKLKESRKSINYDKTSESIKEAWKLGKFDNRRVVKNRKPLTKEHKDNISNALKKSHANGNHTGWKHINSDPKNMSRPERIFSKIINEFDFFKSYNIIYGLPVSKYFLDFAILELKIDIEIDGVQHIRNKDSINHDIKRDRFLIKDGWKVYRISVKELYENEDNVISELCDFITNESHYRKYNHNEILKKYKKAEPKYGNREDYMSAKIKKNNELAVPLINMILESNIDFSKYGWVSKSSELIGIKPQKINKWMKRHMPEFYEKNCFKRK